MVTEYGNMQHWRNNSKIDLRLVGDVVSHLLNGHTTKISFQLTTESQYNFRPKPKKPKVEFWVSAETETMPKVVICQLSEPKPKPNFGRPLTGIIIVIIIIIV